MFNFVQKEFQFTYFNIRKGKKMKRKIISFLLIIFFVTIINAQNKEIEFEEYDLDNGMHVILHEDHSTPIVAVTVMFHVGSKNEQPDRTGFAHFSNT